MIEGINTTDEYMKRNSTLFNMGSPFSSPSHSNKPVEGHFYNNEKFMKTSSPLGPVDFSEKLKLLDPKPYPGEDLAITRDSDVYLTNMSLGSSETSDPGKLSVTGSTNSLLKEIPSDKSVRNDELVAFLGSNKDFWGGENFALLLAKKLYFLNKQVSENLGETKRIKNDFRSEISDTQILLNKKIEELEERLFLAEKAQTLSSEEVNSLNESGEAEQSQKVASDELENKFSEIDIGISSAHTKIIIIRRELYEKINQLNVSLTKDISNIRASINYIEEKTDLAQADVDALECVHHDEFGFLKGSLDNLRGSLREVKKQIESIKESLEATKRQTAISPEFEHFKTMSNHRINNLEGTIKKLQDQISALQKELKVREEAPPSNLFLGIAVIILALFVVVLWASKSENTPTKITSTNPENTSLAQNVTTNQIYPTIGTLNLPINFKGDIVWRSSYFSGGNDVRSVFSYKPTNKTSLNKRQAQTSQKEIMKYLCSTPVTQEFLYKNLRFDCVIENWRNEEIHQFYVTKESCR